MEKKLLIFDLDGTLADTIHTIRDAVNMCMEHFGYPTLTYTQTRDNVGFGARELIRRSLPCEVAENKEKYEEIFEYFTPCYRITHDKIDGCYDGLYPRSLWAPILRRGESWWSLLKAKGF